MSLLVLILSLDGQDLFAQDRLDGVLKRLKINQISQFNYTETRELKLLTSSWQGSGEIFLSPQRIVMAQQLPNESVLIITKAKIHYIDLKRNIHKLKKLDKPFDIPQLGMFLDLIYGEHTAKSLGEKYQTDFSSDSAHWQISLTPIGKNPINQMQIFGRTGFATNKLILLLDDGDQTTWELSLNQQGEAAEKNMHSIVNLALENTNRNNEINNNTLLK